MKKIQVLGEELNVGFNIAAQITYEKMLDKAFDLTDMTKVESRMALYFSVLTVNNPEMQLTMDKLITEASIEDIQALDSAVNEAVSEWYKIPKPAKLEKNTEEEASKND